MLPEPENRKRKNVNEVSTFHVCVCRVFMDFFSFENEMQCVLMCIYTHTQTQYVCFTDFFFFFSE